MQFDCIIGNPPYNNGMDLDFINLGHDLSKSFNVMIVPAKWLYFNNNHRTRSYTIQNCGLRAKINKYINRVVFYPDTSDIFDIDLCGGIVYFIDDHKDHDECVLINVCSKYKSFNSIGYTKLTGVYSLYNIVNDFLKLSGQYKNLDIHCIDNRYIVTAQSNLLPGGRNFGTMLFTPIYCLDQMTDSISGLMTPLKSFESICECENFFSYIDRPLIKLLISSCAVQYAQFLNDKSVFDLVPDPGPFDHLFTDEELYKKFGLSDTDQALINRIIRDRYKSNPSCDWKDFWILNREQLL